MCVEGGTGTTLTVMVEDAAGHSVSLRLSHQTRLNLMNKNKNKNRSQKHKKHREWETYNQSEGRDDKYVQSLPPPALP